MSIVLIILYLRWCKAGSIWVEISWAFWTYLIWRILGYFLNKLPSLGNAAINSWRNRAGPPVTRLLWGVELPLMVLVKCRIDREGKTPEKHGGPRTELTNSHVSFCPLPLLTRDDCLLLQSGGGHISKACAALHMKTLPNCQHLGKFKSSTPTSGSSLQMRRFDWKNVTPETRSGIELKLPEKWKHWHY